MEAVVIPYVCEECLKVYREPIAVYTEQEQKPPTPHLLLTRQLPQCS